ncbi:MAG: 3-oxoadipate CoA-transferase [Gammaproteobacteria bacterium]|jgi:3-oxoadipate CoA-transferase beta subunit|nr:3-oxoadipate CoA-transferase [Gammaproteobacteria bacterium]|tara:strand:- start:963 stop:1655 length:693 start_codon:yes stop_codon:yes gene_type:complete
MTAGPQKKGMARPQIAWRAAQDIPDGAIVNLGIGMPLGIPNYIPAEREVILHSENGLLGMGPPAKEGEEDWELVNAGTLATTLLPGGSYFHHADSFAMIRGGHIDICALGAFQIAANGDLANWNLGDGVRTPTVGGAMDLAVGAKRVFILTDHNARDGGAKIVEECTLPLTGLTCVDRIYTDLAVIEVTATGLVVLEHIEDMSFEELQDKTGAELQQSADWKPLEAPDLD